MIIIHCRIAEHEIRSPFQKYRIELTAVITKLIKRIILLTQAKKSRS